MAKKKVKSKGKQSVKPVKSAIPESISSEVIAEAYSSVPSPVFIKLCRLCESKDGPFLNIFDADKVTAKKIDELMPFGIAENDDLPHKICFRCSAKLEELYEFIQRCIKTQENLRTAVGKTGPFITKTKTRKAWENKLNKTNMSNDDICDALIKKAMEGIKDMPLQPLPVEEESLPPNKLNKTNMSNDAMCDALIKKAMEGIKDMPLQPLPVEEESLPPTKRVTRRTDPKLVKKEPIDDDNEELNLKEVKLTRAKHNEKVSTTKPVKSSNSTPPNSNTSNNDSTNVKPPQPIIIKKTQNEKKTSENKVNNDLNSLSFDYVQEKSSSDNDEEIKEIVDEKPFNIMDYISMIKVNGVGVLFQCKLCNRNFLKKEVVESHNCAKNGIPKVAIPKAVPTPEPPKISTVKYITIEGNMKNPHSWKSYKPDNDHSSITDSKNDKPSTENNRNNDKSPSTDINQKVENSIQSAPPLRPKPKAGPASKTRRTEINLDPGSSQNSSDSQLSESSNSQSPAVHIPSAPNLNGRFKLLPGPNNIFHLVEDTSTSASDTQNQKTAKKRKSDSEYEKSKDYKKDSYDKSKGSNVINVETPKPYPVGLFQTVGHSTHLYEPPVAAPPAPFSTPAMKKQSYTIVQTGNPSKLLISTKAIAPPTEVPKKRQKKSKPEARDFEAKEPFQVTLEDVAHPKDSGFFTFINVDPLLQPSYVLPTDNIIQESQISTSTAAIQKAPETSKDSKEKDKYPCNMCGESFSREKKLLSHIQSHYTKMDEEDQMRAEKSSKKKKGRK